MEDAAPVVCFVYEAWRVGACEDVVVRDFLDDVYRIQLKREVAPDIMASYILLHVALV
jgi:hypothetical protein